MVGALRPAGRGAARSMRRTTLFHSIGLLVGSLITGLVLASIGDLLRRTDLKGVSGIVLGCSLILVLLQEAGMPPPQSTWQVPEEWRRALDMDVLAGIYGFILGFGVFTSVVLSAFWVFVALSLFAPPLATILGWVTYASVRAIGFAAATRRHRGSPRFLSGAQRRVLLHGSVIVSIAAVFVASQSQIS
jgi:hypothetical protein